MSAFLGTRGAAQKCGAATRTKRLRAPKLHSRSLTGHVYALPEYRAIWPSRASVGLQQSASLPLESGHRPHGRVLNVDTRHKKHFVTSLHGLGRSARC